jgi:2-oxoglutarate ferredoxin oxidoreductase subunit alpha
MDVAVAIVAQGLQSEGDILRPSLWRKTSAMGALNNKEGSVMSERVFAQGNEAIGWGAINAGCLHFFGYPITPQNEVIEWFARELPRRGGVFVQSQCETGAINMVMGAGATGVRVMTSTSGPGWSLMQETMSHMANAEIPCVIVIVQRGGPGQGTTQHAQMDYLSATKGGGHGGYRNIVLTPASVQEIHDLVQLAFHLADKYRNPVVVLTDGLLGQMAEPLEIKTLDFGSLPPKDWAVCGLGRHRKDGTHHVSAFSGFVFQRYHPSYLDLIEHLVQKYHLMEAEVRYEARWLDDDPDLIVVAYGYTFRVALEAVNQAREAGLRVGMLRPITVWPFPTSVLRSLASPKVKFLVVEDGMGGLVEDVEMAVGGRAEVHLVNMLYRHMKTPSGMILPEVVYRKVVELVGMEGRYAAEEVG